MEQCTLFWVAFAGFAMLITLIILGILCLHRLAENKELWERATDKLSRINSGLDKLDTAADWFLQKEGMKLDYMHSTWKWYITTTDDGHLRDWVDRKEYLKREALAKALYEANLHAMRDFAVEQKKEAKKK